MKTGSQFLLLLLFVWCNAEAQHAGSLKLNHITHEEGLSQSSGNAILQDSHGYMWFGTQNGLNKYNGYDFSVYQHDPKDSTSISSSHISSIYEDSRGNLWVGTSGAGLNLYDRDRDSFKRFKTQYVDHGESISDNSVSDIIEDPQGKFWIGTSSGLNLFDRDTDEFIHFYAVEGDTSTLSSSNITKLYIDRRDRLWIGTTGGLNYWDDVTGTFGHYKRETSNPNSLTNDYITEIYEDSSGNLWIGTGGGGLFLFDRDRETFLNYRYDEDDPESISGNNILSILEDSRGILWIGTENKGLNTFDYDNHTFRRYKSDVRNPASLNHNTVSTLYENVDNILWIGTYSGGISYIDRKIPQFEHYYHDPFASKPLSNNNISSFLETRGGSFLVGTDGGGLNIFDRETGEFTIFRHTPYDTTTLSSDVILALHEDRKGRIWLGYYGGGVSMYDQNDGSIQHYRHDPDDPHSLSSDHVFVIHEGSNGELWFGTNGGGIHQLDTITGRFERIGTETPGTDVTRALYEDKDGNLWVGSYGGGLIQLNKEDGSVVSEYFEGPNGLTSNVVFTIHENSEGNLWLGTSEGGLLLFDKESETFTSYSNEADLIGTSVFGILKDDRGHLWLSTENGLVEFNPETETSTSYNIEHGVQSSEFNPLAYYKDREGYLYFGGINGFNRFHPERVVVDENVPPVVLTDFKIFNQSISAGEDSPLKKHISQAESITVPFSSSVLTFDFVSLNFNKNKGDQFAYKLDGFDSEWNYVDDRRSATYTNLSPGNYRFRVKSANNHGVWGETESSVDLTVTPPFWRTSWFYLLSLLGIAGTIGGFIRWRERDILRQNKRLEIEVARQTRELKKALDELKDTKDELMEKAHKAGMADVAASVMHNVGNILNSVNVSTSLMDDIIRNSQLQNLHKANRLLQENLTGIEDFILNNPKGKELLKYYVMLDKPIAKEYANLKKQNDRLSEKINLIVEVIAAQQNYSTAGRIKEYYHLEQIIDDTLTIQSNSFDRHRVSFKKDYSPTDSVLVEKTKLIHVLVNLFKNAVESIDEQKPANREITIQLHQDDSHVHVSIADTGAGFKNELKSKIFNHGFTTKKDGHGYGLHSCANYLQEMGGQIKAESDGPGKGAVFVISLPLTKDKADPTDKNNQPHSEISVLTP